MNTDDLDSMEKIQHAFMGIFTRLERQSPEVRGLVLWALSSKWCMGCGQTYDSCDDDKGPCCGVSDTEVTARMCPACEMIRWNTVTRTDGVPMRDRGDQSEAQ